MSPSSGHRGVPVRRSGLARAMSPLRRRWFRFRAEGVPAVFHPDFQQIVWGVPVDPLRFRPLLLVSYP